MLNGQIAGVDSDADMSETPTIDYDYESPYAAPYDEVFRPGNPDVSTLTRNPDFRRNMEFEDDWIPDFSTESE